MAYMHIDGPRQLPMLRLPAKKEWFTVIKRLREETTGVVDQAEAPG